MAWKPISISNLFFISLSSFHFVAPSTQLYGRSGCDIDPDIDIEPTLDGPTSDQSPGIGVEFETSKIVFQNNECSYEDTNGAKGKEILGRTGDDWKLTADTTVDTAGILQAEYILDGTIIKIDTGRAKSAAAKLQNDLAAWNPSTGGQVDVEDSPCNPWSVDVIGDVADALWLRQVTAPLPLEGINDLMRKATVGEGSPLLPWRKSHVTWVQSDFFQSSPGGLTADKANEDVRGFLALVLSYAKAAEFASSEKSPKFLTSIMPRTDFVTMYNLIKEDINVESLSDVVEKLACYRNEPHDDDRNEYNIDMRFCSGDIKKPILGNKFGNLFFEVCSRNSDECRVSVRDWINGLQDGVDMLKKADEEFDGQIGGLNDATEQVLGTRRAVPLFEFRDLGGSTAGDFEKFVDQAEQAIINYHRSYANAPQRMMRSRFKRQAGASTLIPCPAPKPGSSSSITPTMTSMTASVTPSVTQSSPLPSCSLQNEDPDQGIYDMGCICDSTTTLPLLTIPSATDMSQSCSYTALPSSASNPITIPTNTWTTNCEACTLVGGIADSATCTSVSDCTPTAAPTPPFRVWLSNNSIPIGDATNDNDGKDLRTDLYDGLKGNCPDDDQQCDTTTTVDIHEIPSVVDAGVEFIKLTFTFQDSNYTSTDNRDRMLAAAVSLWQKGASKSCQEVEYEYPADMTESGCGAGPVKREKIQTPRKELDKLKERSPICENCDNPEMECKYTASVCAAPDHITVLLDDEDGNLWNHMNIGVSFSLDGGPVFNEFVCELVIEGLTAVAMTVAPELAGAELFEGIEFASLCDG